MDDFDDDSFMADDLFLAEIDNLAARAVAVKRTVSAGPALQQAGPVKRTAINRDSTSTSSAGRNGEAPITARTGPKPAFTLARPTGRTVSAPMTVANRAKAPGNGFGASSTVSSSNLGRDESLSASELARKKAAEARRAAMVAALRSTRPAQTAAPTGMGSGHDAHLKADKVSDAPRASPSGTGSGSLKRQSTLSFGHGPTGLITSTATPTPNAEAGPSRPRTTSAAAVLIPSSRLSRTSSTGHGSGAGSSGGVQIHLNFRRENQTTKGKRWDRTEYAQTGRRIRGGVKGKSKGVDKGRGKRASMDDGSDADMDMDEFDEDDEGEPLVPEPKPLVDVSKPYPPPKHPPLPGAIDTYIYPTNRPKRDYQFEIVQACFTDNCLVALPTGLGKTFVAGVVMLNFYRWFPTGKIVFLAPTKPLVNQQIEACQLTCGIPSMDAAVMTGSSVSAKERAKLWKERRVFYCTPQTLDNDLKANRLDPHDIVLAVFDEAHKASGSYAYTTILAFLMAHQPYFRVLALTATPGADVPKVQGVVDALHISRIEIREAEDPNISRYMNEKHTERHVVFMGDKVEEFRDRWAALMKPYIAKLVEKDILNERDLDAKKLKPFRLTHQRMQITQSRDSGQKWAFGPLNSLEKMARAMTHLLEFSLGMFHTTLSEIAGNMTASGKKATSKGNSNALRNNFEFQKLLRDVETEMNLIRIGAQGRTKGDGHPKMTQTMELIQKVASRRDAQSLMGQLLEHFTKAEEDEKEHGVTNDTRAMVFCSYRECVLDIVDMLNVHSPVLRATKFVGQSQGKQDRDKGFNQKEQKKTINDFKEGKYNILVSTSIGEEGLDIGEVDFVVIYDMPKQSIKLLQRIGRTGRKRAGQVHVLMSEGREDLNWDKAQDSHREIQEEILHSRNLELFEDVERLLPPGHFPKVEEMQMEVDPWDPENLQEKLAASKAYQKAGAPGKKGEGSISLTKMVNEEKEKGKRKTKGKGTATGPGTHRGAEIPEDAPIGFKSVAELLREAEDRRAMRRREAAKAQAGYSSDLDFDDLGEVAEYEQEREVRDDGMRRESERRARSPVKRKRKRGASPVRSESEDYEDDIGDGDPFAEFDARNTAKGDKQLEKSPAPKSSKVKNVKAAKPKAKVERPAKAASKSTAKTAQHRGTSGRTVGVPNRDGSFSGDDDIEVLDATDDVKADHGASRGGVENNQEPALQLSAAAYAPASSPFRIGTMNFDDFDDIDMAQFDDTRPSSPALRSPAPAARTKAVLDPPAKRTVAKTKQVRESEAASVPSSGQALDFFNTSGPIRRGGPSRLVHPPSPPDSPSPSPSPAASPVKSANRARDPPSSPFQLALPPSPHTDESLELERERAQATAGDKYGESADSNSRLSPRTAKMVGFSQIAPVDLNWDLDLDDDEGLAGELFPQMLAHPPVDKRIEAVDVVPMVEHSSADSAPARRIGLGRPRVNQTAGDQTANEMSHLARHRPPHEGTGAANPSGPTGPNGSTGSMLPPPVPARDPREALLNSPLLPSPAHARSARITTCSDAVTTPTFDATQFPVRRGGPIKRKVIMSSSEAGTPVVERQGRNPGHSSPLGAPVRQVVRGKKRRVAPPSEPSSPAGPPVRVARPEARAAGRGGKKGRARRADVEALMDMTAELSGSASSDESGSDLDRETHSDRIFAGEEFAPTQAPQGYDQRAMYRAGLSTQAGTKAGLGFRPNKRKEAFLAKARKPVYVTDDEGGSGSENDYELGSFVVDDEDELL